MGTFKWRSFAPVPFLLLFFTLFTCNLPTTSTQLMSSPLQEDNDICKMVYCGKGACHHSNDLIGFKCDCDSGWKKFNIGAFEFPPCVIPNCTFDFRCGNGSSPPPPTPPPPFNLSDPCLLNLCGDGTCVRNGSGFRCQCNEGSVNLLKDPKLTCFKKCALGADCSGLDLGFGSQTPPATPSPPPQNSGSPGTGLGEKLNCSRELHMLIITMMLAAIFLNWT